MKNKQYLEDVIFRYTTLFGRRYRKNDKIRFLNAIKKEAKLLGYGDQDIFARQGQGATNIYVGKFEETDIVLMSNYDTPMKHINQSVFYPFDKNKQQKDNMRTVVIIMAVVVTVYLFGFFVLRSKGLFEGHTTPVNVNASMFGIAFFLSLLFIIQGVPRQKNYLNNSSSIVGVLVLTKMLREQGKAVSFIFTDQGNARHQGDQLAYNLIETHHLENCYFLGSLGASVSLFSTASLAKMTHVKQATLKELMPKVTFISSGKLQENNVVVEDDAKMFNLDYFNANIDQIYTTLVQH